MGVPPPLPLAYDELPPGSDIRRDVPDEAGERGRSVYLTVPASSELPLAAMKQAAIDALVASVPWSVLLLGLSCAAFVAGLRINRISGTTLPWAWAFFAVFCVALVGLVAWVRYGLMTDALRLGREQATAIAATPARLVIETSGPFGVASYDLPAERVVRIVVERTSLRDDRGSNRALWHVSLRLADGRTIAILPGRDPRELRWVGGAIRQVMTGLA